MTNTTVTPEVTFSDPEQITVANLRPGDFVVEIPTQQRVRGYKINSAIKTIKPMHEVPGAGEWKQSAGYRRPRTTVMSRVITFQSRRGSLNIPDDFTVTVRRMVTK